MKIFVVFVLTIFCVAENAEACRCIPLSFEEYVCNSDVGKARKMLENEEYYRKKIQPIVNFSKRVYYIF